MIFLIFSFQTDLKFITRFYLHKTNKNGRHAAGYLSKLVIIQKFQNLYLVFKGMLLRSLHKKIQRFS